MGIFKIIGGIVLGVGAVALVPFTGGGSLLGAATLAGSLVGAGAAASGAGVVGGIIGEVIDRAEKKKMEETQKNSFTEGATAANNALRSKFFPILKNINKRDEFIVLISTIGIAVAKSDGNSSKDELAEIEKYAENISTNPYLSTALKNTVRNVLEKGASFEEVRNKTMKFLDDQDKQSQKSCITTFNELIEKIINVDKVKHPKEVEFQTKWFNFIKNY